MEFNLNNSIEILERTPQVIEQLLKNLSPEWINANEGENTFNPYDVVSHIGQIVRVMSKLYKDEVGSWINYLPILTR
jgi:hypothetical protein